MEERPRYLLTAETSALLFGLVEDLGVEFGYERSFKLLEGEILAYRYILSLGPNAVKKNPPGSILEICRRLEMPGELLADFERLFPRAHIIHFGIEETRTGCIVKAYLEFVGNFRNAVRNKTGPFHLYAGYKWDAADPARRAITTYTCYPSLNPRGMLRKLSDIYGPAHGTSRELARRVLEAALGRVMYNHILYVEVEEAGNPRTSYDLSIYKAKLTLRDVHPVLAEMCRHFSIPPEAFRDRYEAARDRTFGHLSGGIDREGRDFFTVYFGAEGRRKGDPR